MSEASFTFEQTQAKAEAKNLTVRLPKPYELFLDIDSEEDFEFFQKQYDIANEHGLFHAYVSNPSKSGLPKRHVVVIMTRDVVDATERVMLQALLGSDRKRELLSYLAINFGNTPHPTVFFEAAAE